MDMLWIAVFVVVLLAAAALWLRSRGTAGDDSSPHEDLDTLVAWAPQATRILTSQERMAMAVLMRALPDHMILAQVPLARFLKVPTRHSYAEWLHRVGQLCADLVVCDSASQVVAIVDVRPPAEKTSGRASRRHARMRRVLKAAGIPMHVWVENNLPSPIEARAAILPASASAPAPLTAGPAPSAAATASAAEPQAAVGATAEEALLAMREPPPSTWFDNLDSDHAPLGPRPGPPPA